MLNLKKQVGMLLDAQEEVQKMIDAGEGDVQVLSKEWDDLREAIECLLDYCESEDESMKYVVGMFDGISGDGKSFDTEAEAREYFNKEVEYYKDKKFEFIELYIEDEDGNNTQTLEEVTPQTLR